MSPAPHPGSRPRRTSEWGPGGQDDGDSEKLWSREAEGDGDPGATGRSRGDGRDRAAREWLHPHGEPAGPEALLCPGQLRTHRSSPPRLRSPICKTGEAVGPASEL